MTLLLTFTPSMRQAGQDAWIAILLATLGALVLATILLWLLRLYPRQTIVEISQSVLGKWLGKLLMIPMLVVWLTVTGMILRQFTDFAHLALFDRTPIWVLILPFLALSMYATQKGGIEGIARSAEIVGPIVLATFSAVVLLSLVNMQPRNLFPVFGDTGVNGLIQGTLPCLSFFGEAILFTMVIPFVEHPEGAWKAVFLSVILTGIVVCIGILTALMLFGPDLGAKLLYPSYEIARYISVMNFIQNIDSIVVIVWFLSYFVKASVYFFVSTLSTAQVLGMKNWKPITWGVLVVVFAVSVIPQNFDFPTMVYPQIWESYIFPINLVGIPIFLLLVGLIRQGKGRKAPSGSTSS